MREIIFRGKRKDNGEWVYGNLVKSGTLSFISEDEVRICAKNTVRGILTQPREVIPETVGQYTGVCDNNGEKIFEGDIINWKDYKDKYRETPVFFNQEHSRFCTALNGAEHYGLNRHLSDDITVVGNLYEKSYPGVVLKPCPFCGKSETVLVGTNNQIEEDSDITSFAVNCSANKGGCGAAGGYMRTKKEAIEKWNTRDRQKE